MRRPEGQDPSLKEGLESQNQKKELSYRRVADRRDERDLCSAARKPRSSAAPQSIAFCTRKSFAQRLSFGHGGFTSCQQRACARPRRLSDLASSVRCAPEGVLD